jgi:hypothetical protein
MTYSRPELSLVGAAQNVVLGAEYSWGPRIVCSKDNPLSPLSGSLTFGNSVAPFQGEGAQFERDVRSQGIGRSNENAPSILSELW